MSSSGRALGLLAACQALLFANNSTLIAVNGLAGLALAPAPALATLPVTCWVLGGALVTVPASHHMRRVGRARGLRHGAAIGVFGALVCTAAMLLGSFWLLCAGTLVWGSYNAFGQYYRFAAAEAVEPPRRAQAISLVLAGGLAGGILGPTTSRFTADLWEPRWSATYAALALFALAAGALLSRLKLPAPPAEADGARGRPLAAIAAQPAFVVAVLSAAIGYGVMNFLMTATPLAMQGCGHPYGDAAFVISSHVVAMFAPSFFTGTLIARVGVLPVLFAGAALNAAAIAVALAGQSVAHFWVSLVALGVGWNFLYVGGTSLLTTTYRPEERATAQGANEFAIFATMALSSLASGMVVTVAGWEKLNMAALPAVALVAAAVLWLAARNRRAAAR